jgi:glucan biosynthesis protein C
MHVGRPAAVEREIGQKGFFSPVDHRPLGRTGGARSSLALKNLRAVVVLIVVAFHSSLAYLGSTAAGPFPFDQSPYLWRAFPIVDDRRWFGFDLFCAWEDVYLMSLMFFLSALFVSPSLARKGGQKFLNDRVWRLGPPFLFGVAVVMPISLYPVFRVTAADPSLAAYAEHYLALPFWPNGPMWFLWMLMTLTTLGVALHRFLPNWIAFLGRISAVAAQSPSRYFICLAAVAALAYVPLALIFTPWRWAEHGPFAVQFSRLLLYGVYFFAGFGVGACDLERGLLSADGALARRWRLWLALAVGFLMLWMGLMALTMSYADAAPLALRGVADVSYALASVGSFFLVMAGCLRFAAIASPALDHLSNNAMAVYLLHYAPVVWLQYALLGVALPAIVKGVIVFSGALLLSLAAAAAIRAIPFGARLIGEPVASGQSAHRRPAAE